MLMVIFGAGASYDSSDRHRPQPKGRVVDGYGREVQLRPEADRPPLANDLFSSRFDGYAGGRSACKAILPRLRAASADDSKSIEQELEAISLEATNDSRVAGRLLDLRWYLRDVITDCSNNWLADLSGVTNYAELLGHVATWCDRHEGPAYLVTFNYDMLLEAACVANFGGELGTLTSYVSRDDFKLFKVHGSVGWTRRVERRDGFAVTSLEAFIMGRLPMRWTDVYEAGEDGCRDDAAYVPAIAVPTMAKSGFECPPEHLKEMAAALPEVTALLLIGWRAQEQHFLGLWRDAAAGQSKLERALIVTGKDKKESAENVMSRLVDGTSIDAANFQLSEAGGFTESLRSGEIAQFLDGSPHGA